MNKTISLFTLTGIALASIALTSSLMAAEPLNPDGLLLKRVAKPEIKPNNDVCDMPVPPSLLKQLKDMEANGDCIDSILSNKKAKTTIDKLKAPMVLKSMEDALKHLTRGSMEKIDVDFEKDKIVIFAWQGSGQDSLEGRLYPGKGAAAILSFFNYNPGRTEDLRTRSAIYSMPKGTQIKISEARMVPSGDGIELLVLPDGQRLQLEIQPQQLQGGIQLRVQPQKKAE